MGLRGAGRLGMRLGMVTVIAVAVGVTAADPLGVRLTQAAASRPVADRLETTIVIPVGGAASGFSPQTVSAERGGAITIVNNDNVTHSVTSDAVGTQGDPLFDLVIPSHATRTLVIPADLGAGQYAFYCTFHPHMRGTLVVTGEPGGEVPQPPAFEQALRIPEVLTGRNIKIHMRQAKVAIMPHGPKTRMWTYDGTFPGPTIKRPTGSQTSVTFVHDLPKSAGSLTVHQHGGHQSSADDGQPTRQLIRRGTRRTYTYPLVESGKPMPASFRFYHDHRMDRTAPNNWRGLQGMFLVTDEREEKLGLPSGQYDVPLHFSDRSFTARNQLTDPFPSTNMHEWMTGPQAPPDDATVGKRILVNGQFAPYLGSSPAATGCVS